MSINSLNDLLGLSNEYLENYINNRAAKLKKALALRDVPIPAEKLDFISMYFRRTVKVEMDHGVMNDIFSLFPVERADIITLPYEHATILALNVISDFYLGFNWPSTQDPVEVDLVRFFLALRLAIEFYSLDSIDEDSLPQQ